jgi:hypothetical protein
MTRHLRIAPAGAGVGRLALALPFAAAEVPVAA